MKKLKTWFWDLFILGGISPEELDAVKKGIDGRNRRMLGTAAFIGAGLTFFLFCISFFSPGIAGNRLLYLLVCVLAPVIWLAARFALAHGARSPLPFCYLMLELYYLFAILLGTVMQPSVPATSFSAVLLIGPLLLLDRPYRMSLFLLANTVIFCHVSFAVKDAQLANLDEINMMSIMILAIAVNCSITQIKLKELVNRHYIEVQKDTDPLTGLLRKPALEHRVQAYIASTNAPAAFLILDIDDFKQYNDTYGHAYGDLVLNKVGECIRQAFRKSDLAGRFGGDEFVLFLPHMESSSAAGAGMERLFELLREQFSSPAVRVSAGVAFYPADGADYTSLLQAADKALYHSKGVGKSTYSFYGSLPGSPA